MYMPNHTAPVNAIERVAVGSVTRVLRDGGGEVCLEYMQTACMSQFIGDWS